MPLWNRSMLNLKLLEQLKEEQQTSRFSCSDSQLSMHKITSPQQCHLIRTLQMSTKAQEQ